MSPGARRADLALWTLAAAAASLSLIWAFPRAFPSLTDHWRVRGSEAVAIARGAFRQLGEPLDDPYVVASLSDDKVLERRLWRAGGAPAAPDLAASQLGRRVRFWSVWVYPPGAEPEDWAYYGAVSLDGRVIELARRDERQGEGGGIDPAAARRQADELLRDLGHDPEDFSAAEPRRVEKPERTDLVLRYRDREAVLGDAYAYGFDVEFAGERLHRFHRWFEDADREQLVSELSTMLVTSQARLWAPYLLFPLVALPFLRRYHAGAVAVRRGVQVFLLLSSCGAILIVLVARAASVGNDFDISRRQTTLIWGLQLFVLWVAPVALTAALAWAVGEVRCRRRWGTKLAAFDALLRGRPGNATVARAALRGPAAGLVVAAGIVLLVPVLEGLGVGLVGSTVLGPMYVGDSWQGLSLLLFPLLYSPLVVFFAVLYLLPAAARRLGLWPGAAVAAAILALVTFPPFSSLPVGSDLLLAALPAAAVVALFLTYDLLTALFAAVTARVAVASLPFLFADDAVLQIQGALPLVLLALPLLVSLRGLARGEEAVYRWEEVPPHVRRIASRERQRLELETARRIQSSILPQLPSRLDGVELAHVYLPATEVGGDFYEAAELPDGRLALAVGDVAGHGVASGLVMAMARSALATQLPIDPSVEAVFGTLNRILHETSENTLMTTLCYGLLDRRGRRLVFASAGHLFPYVVSEDRTVRWLESVAYPLGVRRRLELSPTEADLSAGDALVLVSDGVVEARLEETDELFGFDRLEECLRRHAGASPAGLCHEVLADVARFTGPAPREDDQTILVARLS
ncbi:MAG: PP2C family protein-serine/threonine phosphatase [bacterium]|nr:PP2C family protein-serine/threonine phosphatase [bacterium]